MKSRISKLRVHKFNKYNLLFVINLIAIIFVGIYVLLVSNNKKYTPTVLAECIIENKASVHYHATIKIVYLGNQYVLPNNIGYENGCLHPIQVHDGSSGQIHVHYYKKYPFTIGDFFKTWGVIFNERQLGEIMTGSRYKILMKVNDRLNNTYQHYVFKNNDMIEINIKKK